MEGKHVPEYITRQELNDILADYATKEDIKNLESKMDNGFNGIMAKLDSMSQGSGLGIGALMCMSSPEATKGYFIHELEHRR